MRLPRDKKPSVPLFFASNFPPVSFQGILGKAPKLHKRPKMLSRKWRQASVFASSAVSRKVVVLSVAPSMCFSLGIEWHERDNFSGKSPSRDLAREPFHFPRPGSQSETRHYRPFAILDSLNGRRNGNVSDDRAMSRLAQLFESKNPAPGNSPARCDRLLHGMDREGNATASLAVHAVHGAGHRDPMLHS